MADQNLTEEECQEVLEYLRRKVREFGFAEADEALGEKIEGRSYEFTTEYVRGLIDYLQIFSEESIGNTEMMFREALGSQVKVPFEIGSNSSGEEQDTLYKVDLRQYQKCWELIPMLKILLESLGPTDTPQSAMTP